MTYALNSDINNTIFSYINIDYNNADKIELESLAGVIDIDNLNPNRGFNFDIIKQLYPRKKNAYFLLKCFSRCCAYTKDYILNTCSRYSGGVKITTLNKHFNLILENNLIRGVRPHHIHDNNSEINNVVITPHQEFFYLV